jgi:hypothetical protein
LSSDSYKPEIEMFLHCVAMQKSREIQQKRPGVRNKPIAFYKGRKPPAATAQLWGRTA